MRARLTEAMKDAMRAKDQKRLTTVRMMLSAIKDHDLGIKTVGGKTGEPAGDAEITQILARMIKQRRDSIEAYEKAGRTELAQNEKDQALNQFVQALRGYWQAYYRLRRLTLFDFASGQAIQ